MKDAEYAQVAGLLEELASLPGDDARCERLRTQIIELCLPLTRHIALRYRGRGQALDDLVQAASVGLVSAVNRFDLAKGKDFLAFAIPTMMGEVRKHFRDRVWDVRVPRSLQ
jgi:RNA polymerase sigma-B factor